MKGALSGLILIKFSQRDGAPHVPEAKIVMFYHVSLASAFVTEIFFFFCKLQEPRRLLLLKISLLFLLLLWLLKNKDHFERNKSPFCNFFLFHDSSLLSLKLSAFSAFLITRMWRLAKPSVKTLAFPFQRENIRKLVFSCYQTVSLLSCKGSYLSVLLGEKADWQNPAPALRGSRGVSAGPALPATQLGSFSCTTAATWLQVLTVLTAPFLPVSF